MGTFWARAPLKNEVNSCVACLFLRALVSVPDLKSEAYTSLTFLLHSAPFVTTRLLNSRVVLSLVGLYDPSPSDTIHRDTKKKISQIFTSGNLVHFRFAYHDLTSVRRVDLNVERPDSVRVYWTWVSFLWRKKLSWQQESPAKTPHIWF